MALILDIRMKICSFFSDEEEQWLKSLLMPEMVRSRERLHFMSYRNATVDNYMSYLFYCSYCKVFISETKWLKSMEKGHSLACSSICETILLETTIRRQLLSDESGSNLLNIYWLWQDEKKSHQEKVRMALSLIDA